MFTIHSLVKNERLEMQTSTSSPTLDAVDSRLDMASQAVLRFSEIRYRRLFEAARDGVLLLDPNTRKIIDVNPFMIELLGYTYNEFVGKELWEIGLLKDQQASQEMFRELRMNHFMRYEDLPLKSTGGGTREVEVVANLYQEDLRQVIQCNICDITRRKQVEQELAAARDKISHHAVELEQTIAERTTQLREMIGELEAYSYSISHDMRAPLRAMRGFSMLLLEGYSGQLDPQGIDYLKRIDAGAGRMDVLIQEMLTYTRLPRSEVKMEPVDLDALVRQIIETYPQLQEHNIEINIEAMLPKVLGAEASLAQCISNLLVNAVKFVAPQIKPIVKVRAEIIAPDVRLWVEDNGIGIASRDQVRIFKMFEQVDHAGVYEGNGMGLAIVRKAVERMGGRFGVESEAGRGSRFWIQLKGVNI